MTDVSHTAFMSYSREDSEFALRLARDLRAAGARVWIDQLDIRPGVHWDNAIEDALLEAPQMLVVLSPASSGSPNVRNEISFALEQGKIVVPVIYKDCIVPLQLQRQNRIDFRADYGQGLQALLAHLGAGSPRGEAVVTAAADLAQIVAEPAERTEALHSADKAEREPPEDAPSWQGEPALLAAGDAEPEESSAAEGKPSAEPDNLVRKAPRHKRRAKNPAVRSHIERADPNLSADEIAAEDDDQPAADDNDQQAADSIPRLRALRWLWFALLLAFAAMIVLTGLRYLLPSWNY